MTTLSCGYELTNVDKTAIAQAWQAFETDPSSVAVCTAPLERAHRHVMVVGACGGYQRIKIHGTNASVTSFLKRFDEDTQRGMFDIDRDTLPLEQHTTPLFSTRDVAQPDLVVVLLEPNTFGMANFKRYVSQVRKLVVGLPVLLMCWWYPLNDELLKVALHDVFGNKNVFTPQPDLFPPLCQGCSLTYVDASGGPSVCHELLCSTSDILWQNVKRTTQSCEQTSFETAFTLLKNVHHAVACAAKCHMVLENHVRAGDSVVFISEFAPLLDHLIRSFKKQTKFRFMAFTKAAILDVSKFLLEAPEHAPPGGCCKVIFVDDFFVHRELQMCLHLAMTRFGVTQADVFRWTCDGEKIRCDEWAPAPTKDAVISALRCYL
jgi:hypothetical protein